MYLCVCAVTLRDFFCLFLRNRRDIVDDGSSDWGKGRGSLANIGDLNEKIQTGQIVVGGCITVYKKKKERKDKLPVDLHVRFLFFSFQF